MLRIYDDVQVRRRSTLKRVQMFVLFAGGAASGLWLSHTGGAALLAEAVASKSPAGSTIAARWCGADAALSGLRFDCSLSLPELPRAQDL